MIDELFGSLSFKSTRQTVTTSDGVSLTIEPNDHIGRHIYLTGKFDHSIVDVLTGIARPGDTLLDIGANIGYVSACFLQLVPNSRVIAVDPQPSIADLLRANLPANRSTIYEVAISNSDREERFRVCEGNKGRGKIDISGDVMIRTVSGTTFANMIGEAPALLKVDVEGHEEEVLSSLLPSLNQLPRAIVFEDPSGKSAPNKPIGWLLSKLGYRIFRDRKTTFQKYFAPYRAPKRLQRQRLPSDTLTSES